MLIKRLEFETHSSCLFRAGSCVQNSWAVPLTWIFWPSYTLVLTSAMLIKRLEFETHSWWIMRTEFLGCAADLDYLTKRGLMYSGAMLIKRLEFETHSSCLFYAGSCGQNSWAVPLTWIILPSALSCTVAPFLIKRLDFETFTLSFLWRIMRTEFLGCASDLDYLAKLHCLRLAFRQSTNPILSFWSK